MPIRPRKTLHNEGVCPSPEHGTGQGALGSLLSKSRRTNAGEPPRGAVAGVRRRGCSLDALEIWEGRLSDRNSEVGATLRHGGFISVQDITSRLSFPRWRPWDSSMGRPQEFSLLDLFTVHVYCVTFRGLGKRGARGHRRWASYPSWQLKSLHRGPFSDDIQPRIGKVLLDSPLRMAWEACAGCRAA